MAGGKWGEQVTRITHDDYFFVSEWLSGSILQYAASAGWLQVPLKVPPVAVVDFVRRPWWCSHFERYTGISIQTVATSRLEPISFDEFRAQLLDATKPLLRNSFPEPFNSASYAAGFSSMGTSL